MDPEADLERVIDEKCYRLRYSLESNSWTYKGRGVTLDFPAESRFFFPQDQTAYEYSLSNRVISGKLVHGPFTWSPQAAEMLKKLMEKRRQHAWQDRPGQLLALLRRLSLQEALLEDDETDEGDETTTDMTDDETDEETTYNEDDGSEDSIVIADDVHIPLGNLLSILPTVPRIEKAVDHDDQIEDETDEDVDAAYDAD